MRRRTQQEQHRSQRAQVWIAADIYPLVLAEVAAWQEAHWRLQSGEDKFASAITDAVMPHVRSGLTASQRHQIISRAVETHMDGVSRA